MNPFEENNQNPSASQPDNPQPESIPSISSPASQLEPTSYPISPQKSSKTVPFILAAAGALLLLMIIAVVVLAGGKKKADNSNGVSNNPAPTSSVKKPSVQAKTAQYLSDFENVCASTRISNATPYSGAGPHPITFFSKSIIADSFTSESIYLKDQTWSASSKAFEKTQLVGCFTRKSEGEKKDCVFKTETIPYIAATYDLTVYEAASGKKVGSAEVAGPNTKCPFVASYDKNNPKIYAHPDPGAAEVAVSQFVTAQK